MASILLVEDNPTNAFLVKTLLVGRGHQIRHASDGETALQLLSEMLPELVLLDIQMPVMDGLHLCRHLRAMPRTRALKLVALTANAQTDAGQCFLAAGFDAYLTKPFRYFELFQLVDALTGVPARVTAPGVRLGE